MTDQAFGNEQHSLKAKLADFTAGARDMAHGALNEAMAWSAYQWTVLALLTAIFILVALSYGGIRTELAALKQERAEVRRDGGDHRPRRQDHQDRRQARCPRRAEAGRARAQTGSEAEAAIGLMFR
jgi:hypothetical protein